MTSANERQTLLFTMASVTSGASAVLQLARRAEREGRLKELALAGAGASDDGDSHDDDGSSSEEEPRRYGKVAVAALAIAAATSAGGAVVHGRVRMHAVPDAAAAANGTGRLGALQAKGWGRRTVAVHAVGPAGGANFSEAPERSAYPPGADGDAQHEAEQAAFIDAHFHDEGAEVRTLDTRDQRVGLFGDWLERSGYGKYVEWVRAKCGAGQSLGAACRARGVRP